MLKIVVRLRRTAYSAYILRINFNQLHFLKIESIDVNIGNGSPCPCHRPNHTPHLHWLIVQAELLEAPRPCGAGV